MKPGGPMTETQPTYQINTDAAVTKTYSLTLRHIAMVSDLSARQDISQGNIVRDAIDLYYALAEKLDMALIDRIAAVLGENEGGDPLSRAEVISRAVDLLTVAVLTHES